MLSLEEALTKITASVPKLESEVVPLSDALGRTLAEEVQAAEDLPPFRRSAMDGYAVRASDVKAASKSAPVKLKLGGTVPAGSISALRLDGGQAIRIFTGAMVPEGADAVVPQEEAEESGGAVAIQSAAAANSHVDPVGQDVKEGEVVLRPGELLHARRIAMLAALGYAEVRVAKRPQVGILATGSELVEVDEALAEGKVRNANSYSLSGQVSEAGAEPHLLGIADDTKDDLTDKIDLARDFDALLISAGVSVGEHDLVKDVLKEMGFEVGFWQVAVKPGRPLLFGKLKNLVVFGLPGNPVSAMVTFELFVRPALALMQGRAEGKLPEIWAETTEAIHQQPGRRNFIRGIMSASNGKNAVRLAGAQGSAILKSMAAANCLVVVPEDATDIPAGSKVRVVLLGSAA